MNISVVISAYNEEKNLGKCLEAIKGFADEVIVVDNSSSDKTLEIAKKYTDKVYAQENDPQRIDFQKNFGFSKATCDYILSLDADEIMTKELIQEIKSLDGAADGYWIPRKNFIFGKWIESEMWWPDYQLRLFKRGKGKYEGGVHKSLEVAGRTEKLVNPMIHNNYTSVTQFITKLNNYTDIEASRMIENGYKFRSIDAIRFPADDFFKTFFLQKGYREGLHGLVLSILQAFYMEVVFAKLWEKRGFEEVNDKNFINTVKGEIVDIAHVFRYWFVTMRIDESKNPFKKVAYRATRKLLSRRIKKK